MGFLLTYQDDVKSLAAIPFGDGTPYATLVGSANLDQAYRIANLTAMQWELKDRTNGLYVSVKADADGTTGTFELWGYPKTGGAAQFFGAYTFTTDEADDGNSLYYVDEFVESIAGQHTVTILNYADGRAVLKFDTLGLTYFVARITVLSAGSATVESRAW